ncbi:hypothetical protein [Tropicimonas sediminicola]|uniref:Flagellar assembly protein FliH n=1 Tax=Tropicimonas sediminicola TaxID=1031541 RepID=A0A239JCP6_9RHOB|nr:hypothetical protein [Tropicimonas sediminicola]SNT03681.1 flagellar assembly protein FliH [Tropicimonas sediminicola]
MGRPLTLECFDTAMQAGTNALAADDSAREEDRLQAFDEGYRAGWDDAAKAHSEQQTTISAEFGMNLQELSFTYHEARNAILSEMEGILRGLIDKILPAAVHNTVGETIFERIAEISTLQADVPVEISVCPDNAERLRDLISGRVAPPLTILEEPSLGSGQAFLRLGRSETKIDLDAALQEISDAVTDFFETSAPEEDARHA